MGDKTPTCASVHTSVERWTTFRTRRSDEVLFVATDIAQELRPSGCVVGTSYESVWLRSALHPLAYFKIYVTLDADRMVQRAARDQFRP